MAVLVKYDCIDNEVELQKYLEYYARSDYPSEFYKNFFNFLTDPEADCVVVYPDSVLEQVRYRRLQSEFEVNKKKYPDIFNKDEHFVDFVIGYCYERRFYYLGVDENYGVYYIQRIINMVVLIKSPVEDTIQDYKQLQEWFKPYGFDIYPEELYKNLFDCLTDINMNYSIFGYGVYCLVNPKDLVAYIKLEYFRLEDCQYPDDYEASARRYCDKHCYDFLACDEDKQIIYFL